MDKKQTYSIGGCECSLKESYTLKEWGKILEILENSKAENEMGVIVNLIKSGGIEGLVSVIAGEKFTELTDKDFPEITRLVNDFFAREESLFPVMKASSAN